MPSSSKSKTKIHKLIKSTDELKKAIKAGYNDFAITLNYGLKSCKHITMYTTDKRKIQKFWVFNGIDGSTLSITEKQLMDKNYSNIGEAMKKKAFYIDEI